MTTNVASNQEVRVKLTSKIKALLEKGAEVDEVLAELSFEERGELCKPIIETYKRDFSRTYLDEMVTGVKAYTAPITPTDRSASVVREEVRELEQRALRLIKEAGKAHPDGQATEPEMSAIFYTTFYRPDGKHYILHGHDGRRVPWLRATHEDFESRRKLLFGQRKGIDNSIDVLGYANALVVNHKSVATNLEEVEEHFRAHGTSANDVRLMEDLMARIETTETED